MSIPIIILILVGIILLVSILNKNKSKDPVGTFVDAMDPTNWQIGPIMDGVNYSVNMPLNPSKHPEGWVIEFPHPDAVAGSVHYVTMPVGSLAGKTKVSMTYRVETDDGVIIYPTNFPGSPSIITLYFQRNNLGWSVDFENWRWYATFSSKMPIVAGTNTLDAGFDQNWTAVLTSSRDKNLDAFNTSLADAGRIGFVLGGGDGYGHGVYSTGPARIIVTSFTIS